jgi:cytochrome c biogenesis protein CcmG/thiol:disulfide interchange protein DsbE
MTASPTPATPSPSLFRRFLPLIIFVGLVVLFAIGLGLNPRLVPSPLIDKPVPAFTLPSLTADGNITQQDLKCGLTLFNVFASWCYACRQEHQAISWLSQNGFRVIGLNYKDQPDDAKQWLRQFGNPYTSIASDLDGRVGIDFGVYGAPETFVIDNEGIIRDKRIGPVDRSYIEDTLLPMAEQYGKDKSCS